MAYIEGFVLAVPADNKEAYRWERESGSRFALRLSDPARVEHYAATPRPRPVPHGRARSRPR